jgi:4,5:9,10-diseco-3-hydroxy-5,9,17-trioxoandrosta-1(10),2-diene-4-oate hydrolase
MGTSKHCQISDNFSLHYSDFEPTQSVKGCVVFLHGSGPGASGMSNFQFNVGAFVDAGFRVLVPDLPGYGDSDKPTDVQYTLDYFVGTLQTWLDTLGLSKVNLVGNSLGGAIALGMTLAKPEQTEKLILMATGGIEERETYFMMPGIQAMVAYPMGSPQFTREVLAKLLEQLVFDPRHVTEELIEQRWHVLQRQNPTVLSTMQVPNLSDQLKNLSCPVLSFWGRDDKFCPVSGAQTLLTQCETIKCINVSQCGHWVMVEHSELFNQESLSFLI